MFTRIKIILRKSKNDPSLSQAIARIVFSSLLLVGAAVLQMMTDNNYDAMQWIMCMHFLYSASALYLACRYPKNKPLRKIINAAVDLAALSAIIYTNDLTVIFIYPIYLWIIVGNGMRFGMKYLYITLGIGLTLFGSAVSFNPAWQAHHALSFSMITGILVLVLFYGTLLRKIYKLNASLETKVKERTSQLKYQLHHDHLTNLRNRIFLQKILEKQHISALFLVDINHFRNINDLYGIEAGNHVLTLCANYFENLANEYHYEVYRVHGDGFAFTLHHEEMMTYDACHVHIVSLVTQLASFSKKIKEKEDHFNVEFTIAAVFDHERKLEKADMAMKHAKQKGKQYIIYDKTLDTTPQIKQTLEIKNHIKCAIDENRIVPLFQPIVNQKGEIIKFESLMRLEKDNYLLPPFFFLETAMKTHQYDKLTAIMINKSFSAMQKLGRNFSINLSFTDIKSEKTVNMLIQQIQKYAIGRQLTFEIIETEQIKDFTLVKNFVDNMRKLGVKIAIDDFGSGYSNFEHILKIMPDYLKIDGSLIKNIDHDPNAYKLVKTIVVSAKSLEIKTIAEFVHSKEVFDTCRELQVDAYQGFYFYEPLRAWDLETLLHQKEAAV